MSLATTRVRVVAVAVALAGLAAGVLAYGVFIEPGQLEVHETSIPLRLWKGSPLRVAVLTDLHVGSPYNGIDRLRRIVETTNSQSPDLVVILGDLVIQGVLGGTFVSPEETARELGRLHAPFGKLAVIGNHDRWLDEARVASALTSAGIRVLRDEFVSVRSGNDVAQFVGLKDDWSRGSLAPVLRSVPRAHGEPMVVLTHIPDVFVSMPRGVAVTLAGHTHGGQVRLPFIGAPIIPTVLPRRFAEGFHVENGRAIFISAGTGTSILPIRLGVPPRIDILTLRAQ